MKILAISGGTKNGTNDAMAREALMGAREQGAEIELVNLFDLNLKPCTGSMSILVFPLSRALLQASSCSGHICPVCRPS